MESIAATSATGTKVLSIERENGDITRVHLNLNLTIGDKTGPIREIHGYLMEVIGSAKSEEQDFRGRLSALLTELFEQDESKVVP